MFDPKEIIFAPSSACNLRCGHCRVTRTSQGLSVEAALAFLASGAEAGIERVGFSGGEPFLAPDFLVAVVEASVGHGLMFDRLMTNGVWAKDAEELRATFTRLRDAGFDGTIGLSADSYHGQDYAKLLDCVRAAHEVFERRDCVEILSVRNEAEPRWLESALKALAEGLGGQAQTEGPSSWRITDAADRGRGKKRDYADGEALSLPAFEFPVSRGASDLDWNAKAWFREDRCEGPGQVLYVHPDGSVAVCCGFANERPQLIAGTVEEPCETVIERARRMPHIRSCYEEGLGERRKKLEGEGISFPGKTGDMCAFCDYLCEKNLA